VLKLTFVPKIKTYYYYEKKEQKVSLITAASAKVKGFSELLADFEKKISLSGKSESTFRNYSIHLAAMALYFECLPTELGSDEIDDYLYYLQQEHDTPSDSYFKHTVFGLRFVFKMRGLDEKRIKLPKLHHVKKLPVVLSREEVKRLLKAPEMLKHRVLFGILYGCGLRCFEARNIKLSNLDFDRKMLHVQQGKGSKDRYVPLCDILIRGIKTYIAQEKPNVWLFNGKPGERAGGDFDNRYSNRSIQSAVKKAAKDAGIIKEMSVHTLRHTYATHLLEDGLDILSIQKLMGHTCIQSTLIYLHVARIMPKPTFSPMETLYQGKK